MEPALLILALFGLVALLGRVGMSLLRLLRGGAETLLAGEVVQARARRGDLTGLQEAEKWRGVMKRDRLRSSMALGFWLGVLIGAPLAGVAREAYAACAVLWLLPGGLVRRRRR
jgi:hypothetical protein